MNWLDYLLIVILLFSAVMSFRKGFSREIIGLAAAFFALLLGMWFYGLAGTLVAPYISSPRVVDLIGFLLVVAAVLIAGGMLGWIVNRFLRTIGLSFFDRLLGAAFGVLRGLLIAMALLTAFMAFGPYTDSGAASSAMVHSRIAPYVLNASRLVVAMAPMELKTNFQTQYDSIKTALTKSQESKQ